MPDSAENKPPENQTPSTLESVTQNLQGLHESAQDKVDQAVQQLEKGRQMVSAATKESLSKFQEEMKFWQTLSKSPDMQDAFKDKLSNQLQLTTESILEKWKSMTVPFGEYAQEKFGAGDKINNVINKIVEWTGKFTEVFSSLWERLKPHLAKIAAIPGLSLIIGKEQADALKVAAHMNEVQKLEEDGKKTEKKEDKKNEGTSAGTSEKPEQSPQPLSLTKNGDNKVNVIQNTETVELEKTDSGKLKIDNETWELSFANNTIPVERIEINKNGQLGFKIQITDELKKMLQSQVIEAALTAANMKPISDEDIKKMESNVHIISNEDLAELLRKRKNGEDKLPYTIKNDAKDEKGFSILLQKIS